MRSRKVRDKPRVYHQTRPRAAGGEHDLANPNRLGREGHGCQCRAVDAKQREIGPHITSDDARSDLAIGRAGANLLVGIEQVIGDEEGLRVDRSTGRRARAASTQQQQARLVSSRRGSQVV